LAIRDVDVSGAVLHRGRQWNGAVHLKGQLMKPTRVQLELSAAAQPEGALQAAHLELSSGAARLVAHAKAPAFDRPSLEQLAGDLELSAPRFQAAGYDFGPFQVTARLDQGNLQVDQFHGVLPGAAADREAR